MVDDRWLNASSNCLCSLKQVIVHFCKKNILLCVIIYMSFEQIGTNWFEHNPPGIKKLNLTHSLSQLLNFELFKTALIRFSFFQECFWNAKIRKMLGCKYCEMLSVKPCWWLLTRTFSLSDVHVLMPYNIALVKVC